MLLNVKPVNIHMIGIHRNPGTIIPNQIKTINAKNISLLNEYHIRCNIRFNLFTNDLQYLSIILYFAYPKCILFTLNALSIISNNSYGIELSPAEFITINPIKLFLYVT